jgi:hypothetical protein
LVTIYFHLLLLSNHLSLLLFGNCLSLSTVAWQPFIIIYLQNGPNLSSATLFKQKHCFLKHDNSNVNMIRSLMTVSLCSLHNS